MSLRAQTGRPSVRWRCLLTYQLVRDMTYRMYGALIALLGAAALMLNPEPTLARSGAPPQASMHSISHRLAAKPLRHHGRNEIGVFWPGEGDFGYAPSIDEPPAGTPTGDVHYTYDVPWDWAHRLPPPGHFYGASCPTEAVKVAGRNGTERTVNVTRCYY